MYEQAGTGQATTFSIGVGYPTSPPKTSQNLADIYALFQNLLARSSGLKGRTDRIRGFLVGSSPEKNGVNGPREVSVGFVGDFASIGQGLSESLDSVEMDLDVIIRALGIDGGAPIGR